MSCLGHYLSAMLQSHPCPLLFCKLWGLDSIISDISSLCNILCSEVCCRRKTPKQNQSFTISLIILPFIKKFSINVAGHSQPSEREKLGEKNTPPLRPCVFHLSRHPRPGSDKESDSVLRGQKINV